MSRAFYRQIMELGAGEPPKFAPVAIVTLVRDDLDGLERTLMSIEAQYLKPESHIVIDGSTDSTSFEVRRACEKTGAAYYWRSPDGVYPAMKEGLARVENQKYCLFLNSNDSLADPFVLLKISEWCSLEQSRGYAWAIGGLKIYDGDEFLSAYHFDLTSTSFTRAISEAKLWIPHPSTLFRVSELRKVRPFEDGFRIAEDFASCVRMLKMFGEPFILPIDLSIHRTGGVSTRLHKLGELENSIIRIRYFGIGRVIPEVIRLVKLVFRWILH